nr:TetR/AcrR family transcriptional regulator [Corynebacterium lactis]
MPKKTGPKPTFAAHDAVLAAMDIGLDDFTLSEVARRLGVATPSLYRVISSREDLVGMCLDHINSEMLRKAEGIDGTWQECMRQMADLFWSELEQVKGLNQVLLGGATAHMHFSELFDFIGQTVLSRGFQGGAPRVMFALDFISDTVLAAHLQVSAMHEHFGGTLPSNEEASEQPDENSFRFVPSQHWAERGWLDRKVTFIISGLEKNLD